MQMPALETERLIIRPFVLDDLEAVHRILDVELADADTGSAGAQSLRARRRWLQWSTLNYEQLALLYQPPYGDRAIVVKAGGALVGACGYVPAFGPFAQLPSLGALEHARYSAEFGLYWGLSTAQRGRGYATEAARALIGYAFDRLHLARIVATTSYDNLSSQRVMQRCGMRIEHNPYPDPAWFQAVGILSRLPTEAHI